MRSHSYINQSETERSQSECLRICSVIAERSDPMSGLEDPGRHTKSLRVCPLIRKRKCKHLQFISTRDIQSYQSFRDINGMADTKSVSTAIDLTTYFLLI